MIERKPDINWDKGSVRTPGKIGRVKGIGPYVNETITDIFVLEGDTIIEQYNNGKGSTRIATILTENYEDVLKGKKVCHTQVGSFLKAAGIALVLGPRSKSTSKSTSNISTLEINIVKNNLFDITKELNNSSKESVARKYNISVDSIDLVSSGEIFKA